MVDLFEEIHDALRDYALEIIEYKEKREFKDEDWLKHEIYAPLVVGNELYGTPVRLKPTGILKKTLNHRLQSDVLNDLLELPAHKRMINIVYREIAKEINKDISEFISDLQVWGKTLVDMRLSDWKFVEQIFYSEFPVEQIVNDFAYGFIRKYPPVKLRFRVYLRGVILDDQEIDAGIFTIRKPVDSDFTYRIITNPLEEPLVETHDIHSILEWSIKDFSRPDRGRELWEVQSKIELLRLGIGGNWRPVEWNVTVLPEPTRLAPEVDIENNRFLRVYEVMIPSLAFTRVTAETASWFRNNGIKILKRVWGKGVVGRRLRRAIRMHEDATFRKPIESILFSIIGFETLFSLKNRQELRLKTTLQVATMTHLSGWIPKMVVYDDVEKGYSLRNTFVHGGDTKDDTTLNLSKIFCEYLRACILMWTFSPVKSGGEIDTLNRDLLRASFDDAIEQKLQEKMKLSKNLFQDAALDYGFHEHVKAKTKEKSKQS